MIGCAVPGKAFLRRLYNLTINVQCPDFLLQLSEQAKADSATWELFMDGFNGKRILFSEDWWVSDTQQLNTNAASPKGFAAVFGTQWFMHAWP